MNNTTEADTQEEQLEMDMIDDDEFREQAIEALMGLGLPEDEAEMQVDDLF
jgi:Holliday junction resolvasome RuvABC DNA-binding subunit